MQIQTMQFKARAGQKLADQRLQQNLTKLSTKFVSARAAAMTAIDFPATRAALKERRNRALDMLIAQREVIRAQAINRNLPGDDTYDSAPVRGQFSRAQQRWYAVSTRARTARDAFEHASTDLASAKEAYAQIMRNGPARMRGLLAADDHPTHLELAGWVANAVDPAFRRPEANLATLAAELQAPLLGTLPHAPQMRADEVAALLKIAADAPA